MPETRVTESVQHRIEWTDKTTSKWNVWNTRDKNYADLVDFISRLRAEPANKNMQFRLREIRNICTETTLEV